MHLAGAKMANTCFNLAQRGSTPLSDRDRQLMQEMQVEWDAAIKQLREANKVTKVNP